MDFKRIEVIFLFVFIALDIFLFSSYRQSRNAVVSISSAGGSSLTKEMSQDNITLAGKLDNHPSHGYYLASTEHHTLRDYTKLRNQSISYNSDKDQINSTLDEPILVFSSQPWKTINKYKNKDQNVLFGKEYQYCANLSDRNNLVYVQTQKWGQFYSLNGRLTFQLAQGRLVGYQQTYIGKLNVLRKKQSTISERRAVDSLYTNNELPNNSQVKWTSLAYNKLLNFKGSTIYIPIWYVGFVTKGNKNMEIRKINAFNGGLMKNASSLGVMVDE